jgi:hypothetical protein
MSFDQSTWDVISGLRNDLDRGRYSDTENVEFLMQRIDGLEKRMADLEKQFQEMKKAVCRS